MAQPLRVGGIYGFASQLIWSLKKGVEITKTKPRAIKTISNRTESMPKFLLKLPESRAIHKSEHPWIIQRIRVHKHIDNITIYIGHLKIYPRTPCKSHSTFKAMWWAVNKIEEAQTVQCGTAQNLGLSLGWYWVGSYQFFSDITWFSRLVRCLKMRSLISSPLWSQSQIIRCLRALLS